MKPQIESLEPRRLLSGDWTTVDDYQYDAKSSSAAAITVDSSGRLYTAGAVNLGFLNAPDRTAHELVRTSSDGGATWSLLSDYVVPGARSTNVYDIEVDAAGNIFLAGAASGGSFVRRSSDSGQTWTTLDSVPQASAADLTIDATGNMYVVGTDSSSNKWLVRRSTDGGGTWSTVDSFSSGSSASASAVFAHPTAGVFVAGHVRVVTKRTNADVWTVRRSRDGGSTWATVDSYYLDSRYSAEARSLGADAAGNVYVVGAASARSGPAFYSHWIVRKSTNDGSTWTTVDNYQRTSSSPAAAQDFVKDSAGNLYVAGVVEGGAAPAVWTVRRSAGGTGAWTTVDSFQHATGSNARPNAIAADQAGRVFVAGGANDSSGLSHWIVRRTPGSAPPAAATFATTSIASDDADTSAEGPTLAEELLGATA